MPKSILFLWKNHNFLIFKKLDHKKRMELKNIKRKLIKISYLH